jgi:hypothetical protein
MSQPSQEVLFHAQCELAGMIADNDHAKLEGKPPPYTYGSFISLAEMTRGEFRNAQQYDTNQ